jgi:hypothetical protein
VSATRVGASRRRDQEDAMTTARTLFTEGLRDHLAPALRALGLTGWRHSFSLPDEEHWALLGIELGADDDLLVRYTVTLSITPKAAWPGPAVRPDPTVATGLESWRSRIGALMPVGEDVWWQVAPGPRWLVGVEDTVAAVRHYGLPELRHRLELRAGVEPYLSPAELTDVNAALELAAVPRIRRAELAGGALELHGAWQRGDLVAREVLRGAAGGFLSAGDERFTAVRCRNTRGRELWVFPAPE